MLCSVCKESLININKRVYYCKEPECSPDIEGGNIMYWCQKCKEETDHEHKRSKFKGIAGLVGVEKDEGNPESG